MDSMVTAFNCSYAGKVRRLSRLFSTVSGKMVLVPMDDFLINGIPEEIRSVELKLLEILKNKPNAIMAFTGLFKNYVKILSKIPSILNLTANTTFSCHTRKTLVSSVLQAIQMNMEGVAVHVNISSLYENEMIRILGFISRQCESLGIPLLAIMYPRKEGKKGDYNYHDLKKTQRKKYAEIVSHAARVAVEIGADIIKTQYTGDPDTFIRVVEACSPVPVLIAGGEKISDKKIFENAYGAIKAGGAGISFGRNVFLQKEPEIYLKALNKVVHESMNSNDALQFVRHEKKKRRENESQYS